MKMTALAASLISAGLASLITAAVVERHMLKGIDEKLQQELDRSVEYLVLAKKAKPTEEYVEKRVGRTFDITKPSLDEVAAKNQKVRYDTIVNKAGYLPEEEPAEDEVEVCDTLGELFPISTEEFMENESGYMQCQVTYFADGGVLDEHGDVVENWNDLIGWAKPPFGELSGEPNIVYLRNVRLRREIEVVYDDANAADILAEPGSE